MAHHIGSSHGSNKANNNGPTAGSRGNGKSRKGLSLSVGNEVIFQFPDGLDFFGTSNNNSKDSYKPLNLVQIRAQIDRPIGSAIGAEFGSKLESKMSTDGLLTDFSSIKQIANNFGMALGEYAGMAIGYAIGMAFHINN